MKVFVIGVTTVSPHSEKYLQEMKVLKRAMSHLGKGLVGAGHELLVCSPWCFDKLDLALKRHKEGRLALWLLCLDDTRVVPPAARELLTYPINSRRELGGAILDLLEPALASRSRGRTSRRTDRRL